MTAHLLSRRLFTAAGLASALVSAASCGRQTSKQETRMDQDQTNVASKDGTRIAFDRSGQGPALILVGGALSDRAGGAPFAERLAPHFTVFNYDRRGRGDSGDTPPYAVEREIEDIDALIDEAGGAAFVYGKSSGAVLSLHAAHALHTKIRKLALYEPPFIIDDARPPAPQEYVQRVNDMVDAGRRGDAVAFFMTDVVGMPADAVAQMRNAPTWPALEALAHTIAYDGAVLGDTMAGRPLPAGRWASVTMPTLVMAGGASPAWMQHSAQSLADVLPNAQHRTLESQTHDVAPDVLVPVLNEFFG
jgi:pimeloyl-ACP methyl ester carboxylesterase